MRSPGRAAALAAVALAIAVGAWFGWRGARAPAAPDRVPPRPDDVLGEDAPSAAMIRAALADVEAKPRDPEAWYRLSLAYQGCNAAIPALECLEQVVALDERHAKAWYHLGLVRDHLGRRDAAIEAIERSVAIDGSYGPSHQRLGELRLDGDDLVAAQRSFENARRADPQSVRAVVGLARTAGRRGDDAGAIALLEPLAMRVDDPQVCQVLGSALARRGRVADAETILARARRTSVPAPDPWQAEVDLYRVGDRAHDRAQMQRAQQLVMAGRFDEAIPILEALVVDDPDNAGLVCNLAAAHRSKGDLNRSAAILERAVQSMPEAWQPHYNLGLVRFTAWRNARTPASVEAMRPVVEQVELAIAANPASAQAHALRGDVHSALGEFAPAAQAYRRAAIAEPSNAAWLAQLGMANARAGRNAEAIEALRGAAKIAPGDPSIVAALADVLDAAGRGDEAAVARAQVEKMTARLRPTGGGGAGR